MAPEQKADAPDAKKDAANTVSEVSRINHDEGSAKAAERLQKDFQDYAQTNSSNPVAIKEYWDTVNKELKDKGTLTPLSLEFAKNNIDKVGDEDGDVSPDSIKGKIERNQDLMDFVADSKLPQAAGRRFDLMMQRELSEKMTAGRDGGHKWVDRDREMDKGDFENRLSEMDEDRKKQLDKEGMRASFPHLLDGQKLPDGSYKASPFYNVLDGALENGNPKDLKIDDNDIDAYIEKANKEWEEAKAESPDFTIPTAYDPKNHSGTKYNQAWMTEAKELQKKFNDLDDDAMFGDLITTDSLRSSLGYGSEAEMWSDGKKLNAPATETAPADGASLEKDPAKPAEAAKPTDPAKPAEAAKPTDPAKPTEAAKPGDPAKPTEAAKPTDAKPKDPQEVAADNLMRFWAGIPQKDADIAEKDKKISKADFETMQNSPDLTLNQRVYVKDLADNFEKRFGAKELSFEDINKMSGSAVQELSEQRDIASEYVKRIQNFKPDENGNLTLTSLKTRAEALRKEAADPATAGDAATVKNRTAELAFNERLQKNFGWFATKDGVITSDDMKNYAQNHSVPDKQLQWKGFQKDGLTAEEEAGTVPSDAPATKPPVETDEAAKQQAELQAQADKAAAENFAKLPETLQLNKDGNNVLYDIARKSLELRKEASLYEGKMDHSAIMAESVRIAIANGLIDEKYRGQTRIPESTGIAGKIKRGMQFKLFSQKEADEMKKGIADRYKGNYGAPETGK